MKKLFATIGILVVVMGFRGIAHAQVFTAALTGTEEVPPVDTATTGDVIILFNAEETAAEFLLTVNAGQRVQQAHIHCGAIGVNGPVVVFLAGFHANGWDVNGPWVGNTTFSNANITDTSCGSTVAELAQAMREGMTYANVHTVAHPGGEVRGQIRPFE